MTLHGNASNRPRSGFVKGADVSHLLQLEDSGARFYEQGVEKDLLQILRDHGLNAIRIKVWNDPGNPCCYPANLADPAGYNNPAHVARLAARAQNLGFRVMIDFHYSDWWADPGKQHTPCAWEGQALNELRRSLYDFTHGVLSALKGSGVTPEWVQIGNEISNGMLWPIGSTNNWDNLAALIKEGYAATKDVDSEIKVVLHYDNGGNNQGTVGWFDHARLRGVEWDVIGLSYYPVWHGSLADLDHNMADLATRYGKDLMVVETAYPWTAENGDEQPNTYTNTGPMSYPMSPAGQTQFLEDLVGRIKAIPDGRGKGFFYWEPEWIPVVGAGWKVGEGDQWDNVTLFDFGGNALSSLASFKNW